MISACVGALGEACREQGLPRGSNDLTAVLTVLALGAGAGIFLFLLLRYRGWTTIRKSRGIPGAAILGALAIFLACLWFPGPFAFLAPYDYVGAWTTTDLDGRPSRVEVYVKSLSPTTPPGDLTRLKLTTASDSITVDTGWRFGLVDVVPVDGGIDALTGLGCFCPRGLRFLIRGARWIEKPEDVWDVGAREWTWSADEKLQPLISLIHNSPRPEGAHFNPVLLIRAVNGLLAAGEDRATRAMDDYRRLAQLSSDLVYSHDCPDHRMDEQRLQPILELLYGSESEGLIVQDDIPFRLSTSTPSTARRTFRTRPLVPTRSPLEAADALVSPPADLRDQVLRAVHNVYGFTYLRYPDELDFRSPTAAEWERDRAAIRAVKMRWDASTQDFVRVR